MPSAIRPGTVFWTKEEDVRLIDLVMQHGKNWRMMKQYFPGRSESSIKCRWHVYLKQNVKGDPPEFKRNPNGPPKRRKRKKQKPVCLNFSDDEEYTGNFTGANRLPRKSSRKRIKPKNLFSPSIRPRAVNSLKARQKRYQELNILIPTLELTGSCSKENRNITKTMLKRVREKTDLELDKEEKVFFKQYCYSPRQGTPIADRIIATNCLASFFFTKDMKLPQEPIKFNINSVM